MKLQNVLLVISLLFFSVSLSAQTCNDGIKNGTEVGVDCGGGCPGICDDYLTDDAYKLTNGIYDVSGIFINVKGGDPNEEIIYLQFDVPTVSQIDGVELELRSQFPNADNIEIYATDNPTWSESNLSNTNAPAIVGSAISSPGTIYNTNIIKWTLDKCAFSSNTTISLIVKRSSSNTNQVKFLSQQQGGGGNQAKLIINRITTTGSCGGGGNTPPTISFTNPSDGDIFTTGDDLTVMVTADDSDGNVTNVDLKVDGVSQSGGTQNMTTYTWMLTNLAAGTYPLEATATDDDEETSTATVNIIVNPSGGSGNSPWITGANDAIYYSTGNVGIGVAAPNDKLVVAGTIRGQRVRILSATDLNFPDYVFAPEYELLPLEAVEKYIQENHHLPEVPSAKEINEKGFTVAEMDATLLKKIEELTLYMIELKKSNDLLQKEVSQLKKQLNHQD